MKGTSNDNGETPINWVHHHPTFLFLKKRDGLRWSVTAGTRKMVNYA